MQLTFSTTAVGVLFLTAGAAKLYSFRGFVSSLGEYAWVMVFDTSRLWCAYATLLLRLYPDARLICCVRSPAWIIDSIERLVHRNAFLVPKLFPPDAANVYTRAETLMKGGMVGSSLQGLRQAWFAETGGRLIAIQYDSLSSRPAEVLGRIYQILGEPPFPHRFDDVEYDATEFDMRLNMPGLHRVAKRVELVQRRTILPPELFGQFDNCFWSEPESNPNNHIVL